MRFRIVLHAGKKNRMGATRLVGAASRRWADSLALTGATRIPETLAVRRGFIYPCARNSLRRLPMHGSLLLEEVLHMTKFGRHSLEVFW